MKRLLYITLLVPLFLLPAGAWAARAPLPQEDPKVTIGGVVLDAQTKEPVGYATVAIPQLGLWGASNEEGVFSLRSVPRGKWTFTITLLGYSPRTFTWEITGPTQALRWEIEPSSLKLQEIVVTATEGGALNSSSRIEQQALEHVQPSSIKDVLQLLPGNLTENPSLNSINKLTIRDLSASDANALGTAVVLDGASVTNDTNLQVRKTGGTQGESTAGSGLDARQMATDNIESIEVIRGIPSVQYGDLTSGAVVVKTRAGVSPWQIRLKADPKLKQVSLGKGFSLGPRRGVLNFDTDYALSYSDTRTPAQAYRRFNLQMGYSQTFAGVFTFNAKVRGRYSDSNNATDPDNFLDNLSRDSDQGLSVNLNGRYMVNKPWLTNIEYVLAADVARQYSLEKTYRSQGRLARSLAMESGENLGFFTPYQYYSHLEVFGLPMNFQGKITAHQYGQYGPVTNKVLLGVEWNSKGNHGEGKVFDPYLSPDASSSSTYRERSYKDIPFLHRYTAFLEDKVQVPLRGTLFELQAGARVNGLVPHAKFSMEKYLSVEPRLNAKYHLLHRPTGFKELSVRAGWGVNYKMPSMVYLYPEPTYLDVVSFSYNDIDDNGVGAVLFTTQKLEKEVQNPLLTLQKSVNLEAAVDFAIGKVRGSVVYFNEQLTHGYSFSTQVMPFYYNRYGYTWENGSPSQVRVPSGRLPQHENGQITIDGVPLPVIRDTLFLTYQKPGNHLTQSKWGIEYTLDFPEIKALKTTVSVNGAYMNVTSQDQAEGAIVVGTQVAGRPFPYAGIYAGGNKTSTGNRKQRLNTNVRFITHIPQAGMVVTLTAQLIFIDKTTYVCEYNNKVQSYYYDEASGLRVSGQQAYKDNAHTKRVNPLYLMDMHGNVIPFTQEMEKDPRFTELIGTTNKDSYYIGTRYPVYGILNIRLTKEIGKWATVSFYANNFLNFDRMVMEKVSRTAYARNLPLYFGAEVKFTL